MSLANRKSKLYQRMRKESKRVNAKYRKLMKQVEDECNEHEFGEWHKRSGGSVSRWKTNFLGEPFYFRSCAHCNKTESMIKRDND